MVTSITRHTVRTDSTPIVQHPPTNSELHNITNSNVRDAALSALKGWREIRDNSVLSKHQRQVAALEITRITRTLRHQADKPARLERGIENARMAQETAKQQKETRMATLKQIADQKLSAEQEQAKVKEAAKQKRNEARAAKKAAEEAAVKASTTWSFFRPSTWFGGSSKAK